MSLPMLSSNATSLMTTSRCVTSTSETVTTATTQPSTLRAEPKMSTIFIARLVNGSTEGRTGSAASVDVETIDKDDPESISVPLISTPFSRTGTNNCCSPPSVGTTAPNTYVQRSDCCGPGCWWSSVNGYG